MRQTGGERAQRPKCGIYISRRKVAFLIYKLIEMSYSHNALYSANMHNTHDDFAINVSPNEKALFDMLRTIRRTNTPEPLRAGTNSNLPGSVHHDHITPTLTPHPSPLADKMIIYAQ